MNAIDSDTHIYETDDTWSYMEECEQSFKPVQFQDRENPLMTYWLIDGAVRTMASHDDQSTSTTVETRELRNIEARLRDMDRMGVEAQVIYPSIMILEVTERPEVELALRRSYNRWMADRCSKSHGRLRWIALPPLRSIDRSLDELRWAKDNGAVGVLKKGDREAGYWPGDDYFFPVYEEAQRLDMPITFHTGSGVQAANSQLRGSAHYYRIQLPVVHAFQSLIALKVPDMFPTLRWGFIEANSSWVPSVSYNLRHMMDTLRKRPGASRFSVSSEDLEVDQSLLAKNRMYVSCQSDEDLPYILKHAGENNLLIGSDYSHNDLSLQMDLVDGLQKRVDMGDISQDVLQKIACDNPRTFYGI